jgi:hypothetical protein
MARVRPTDEDRVEATRRLLEGLYRGEDVNDLTRSIAELHPRDDTFPGEVFLRLAGEALDLAGVTADGPIAYEGLREKFIPECDFRGRENRKIQYAVLVAAAAHGGLEPDVLDEVAWWQTDDFWSYALAAVVAIIRSCAERAGISVPNFAEQLAGRIGITL